MFKDYEVLSFKVDLRKCRATFIEKLEHFDKAPYGFEDEIREILSKSDFYTPDILDFIIRIYEQQKIAFEKYACKKN